MNELRELERDILITKCNCQERIIVELEKEVKKLKKEIESTSDVWIPKQGDRVYHINTSGVAECFNYYAYMLDAFNMGLIFQTREKCNQFREQQQIITELKREATKSGRKDGEFVYGIINWYVTFDHDIKKVMVWFNYFCEDINQVYFEEKEQARDAIKKIGEQRIIKAFFSEGD